MRRLCCGLALLLCSLPASSHAGAWTQARGELWWSVSGVYSSTQEQFAPNAAILDGKSIEVGDRRPFDNDGATRVRLLWSEAEFGVTDRNTLGIQVPYYDLRFEDDDQLTDSWGIGDIRLIHRFGILTQQHRLSTRIAWKLPVGEAATDSDDVPVGEGQSDLDLGLQYGYGLGKPLSWVGIESGYRLRARNDREGRDPGDEFFWRTELGYAVDRHGRLSVHGAWEGLRGRETTFDVLGTIPGQRSFDSLSLGLLIPVGAWIVQPQYAYLVAGEAYPTGSKWALSLHRTLKLGFF
jgi:hypothetical protein